MPDKRYDVDDILREIRRNQQSGAPAPTPGAAAASPAGAEWEEEVSEYRPPAKQEPPAPRARRVQEAPPRPVWEDDEEEPPRPSRAAQTRAAKPAVSQTPSRPVWDDEEEPPRPSRAAQTRAAKSAVSQTPSRPVWDDEEESPRPGQAVQTRAARPARQETPPRPAWDDEGETPRPSQAAQTRAARPARQETPPRPVWDDEEEPPRPSQAAQTRAARPTRQETPPRPVWDDEEEPSRPSRAAQTKAARPVRQEVPPQPLWDEDEEELFRPDRSPEPKVRTPRQAARSQALWEAEDAQPPSESSPAMSRADRSDRQQIPSLSRWEEKYEPSSSKVEITQPKDPSALPLWEDEKLAQPQERPARQAGRTINAAAAAQLLTDDVEKPRRGRRGRDEDEEEYRPRSRRKRDEDEEERPRPRRRREEEDEEERPRSRPRVNVAAQLRGMKNGLIIRLVVGLLCAAGVIYLMLAPGQELPIPEYFMANPGHYLWLGVGLVVLSALVSGNTMGGGIISLFCLRPNNDSYTAIGVFACLVQGAYIAMRPEMMTSYAANLYLPMAALLLLFNTIGKLILRGRVASSYRLIAGEGARNTANLIDDPELAGKIGGDIVDDEPEIAYFARSSGVQSFLEQAFSESKAEDISRVIAPMTAVAALVMALISYPFHKDVFTSACVFTAALCITAPIAGVIVTELPIALMNRRLGRWGATFCGYNAVDQFSGVNQLLLRGYNLFPPESVTLHTVKTFNRASQDQVLADTASVLSQCDSTLTQFIMEMIPDKSVLRQTESFVCEDGKGVSAWVEGRRVLVGNRELMQSHGVALPPTELEEQYQGKQILYISNSGQAAAMYVLSYKGDRQMRRALELLSDLDIAVCVYTADPNITADRISQVYGFPRELVKVIPAALHRELDRLLEPKGRTKAGMIHNGQPSSYVRGVAAARSCDSALTLETALLLLSVVLGFALVTFFAFTGGMPALTWITIAAYQGFWGVVQLLVALFKST